MIIVPAKENHIPGMIRLLRQVGAIHAEGRPDLFRSGAQKYNEAQLRAILQDNNSPIFIAEEDGQVLGYCFCQYQTVAENACVNGRRELYIDDLCVDETARGLMWAAPCTAMCVPGRRNRALTISPCMCGIFPAVPRISTAVWG